MSDQPTIYLAGPIQAPEDNGSGWRGFIQEYWTEPNWLNPLDRHDPEEYDTLTVQDVVEDDKAAIDEADAVLVGWTRVPSVGTPMEILYCYERNIPVVVLLEPEGSRGSVDKRDLSPWLVYHADGIHQSPAAALENIKSYVEAGR